MAPLKGKNSQFSFVYIRTIGEGDLAWEGCPFKTYENYQHTPAKRVPTPQRKVLVEETYTMDGTGKNYNSKAGKNWCSSL